MIKFTFSRTQWIYIACIVSACVFMLFGVEWYGFNYLPLVHHGHEFEVYLKPGSSISSIADQLHQRKILTRPRTFVFMARLKGFSRSVQAGEYRIQPGTTAAQLLNQIAEGRVILRDYTIVEGWTFKQLIQGLHHNAFVMHDLKDKLPADIIKLYSKEKSNPEGYFFPETYLFAKGTNESEVLQNAYNLMKTNFYHAWDNRADNLPYQTPQAALIVASLIEKETAVEAEKPKIAGVIVRRLQHNMLLQIDPTVIYALGEKYEGKLTKADMKVNSPYNTYLHKGLPPTPIAMPGLASINAAMHPDKSDNLYYVAKGDGSHVFSKTFEQHKAAIAKYQHTGHHDG